ncbi:unnamed protein product [Paramecium primaurelia]|uniref:Uncharacterized protein n=1 Tax=Paramecium primaurelia TaxID=5886 RepID=A0A8S1MCN5_PARPR|nr:unnamed protein product [Paramecium primaurelia]
MQQLLKPSLNFDFQQVVFEDNLQSTQQISAQQNKDKLNQQFKKQDKKVNQKNIIRPLSQSGQRSSSNKKDLNQQTKGVESKQLTQQHSSPQHFSAKQVKFDNNKTQGTTSNIQSNCYFSQQNNILVKQPIYSKQQQMDNNNNKQQYQKQNNIKNAGIFDWDDDDRDLDNNFFISQSPTSKIHIQKYESIEKANQQQFIYKQQKTNIIETSIKQNQDILKQQQKEIQQKLDNIQQLRMNELLQNNLVLEQVPHLDEEQYYDDFEQEKQTQKKSTQKMEYEQVYDQDNFEIDEESKIINKDQEIQQVQVRQQQEIETKQSQIKLEKVQDNNKKVKSNESLIKTSKKVVYKAKNAKERKEEIMNMRSDLEKYLLQNNTNISKMFQELQDTKDKERIMIEVSTKRQDELSQAKLTLKQLKEKFSRQKQIIEELDKKEHYANQIIQKLTENKQKYNQQWENQIEKFMACKVIARFLKGRRDRKLFTEFRRQSFINRLKQ